MLTVGSICEGIAVDVDYMGQGIVKHEDLVIFVKGLLTKEQATIKIKTLKKRFAEGSIVSINEVSQDRRNHPDTLLGSMDLLHMSDEAQLKWQTKLTKDTLMKIAGISCDIEPIITDNNFFNYRNKSVFHVMEKPVLTLGLYHEDGRGLVPVKSFVIADQVTNQIIDKLSSSNIYIDFRALKQIAIRTNVDGQALVTLIATRKSFKGLSHMLNVMHNIKNVIGVTLNLKDDEKKILGTQSFVLNGQNLIEEKIGDWIFPVTDQSFFQINIPVVQKAYDLIKKSILPNASVIDAYSGVGSIGYYVSSNAKKVLMIESNVDAIQMATRIKEEKGLQHVEILQGQVETLLQEHQADVLVVDPPRNGLMPELIQTIKSHPFKQMFYLSCDLKTLARDLGLLMDDYAILHVYPIRMFPQTTECETLVILKHI